MRDEVPAEGGDIDDGKFFGVLKAGAGKKSETHGEGKKRRLASI